MRVRLEEAADHTAVYALNWAAFGTRVEADLVNTLREKPSAIVSLVADLDGQVVGHIMFSEVMLAELPAVKVAGLTPMAVAPKHQRTGIGSALVREGLKRCEQLGYQAVVVVGHAKYYPRFGFVLAARHGLRCEYDVPQDAFMVVELQPRSLQSMHGLVRYDKLFADI